MSILAKSSCEVECIILWSVTVKSSNVLCCVQEFDIDKYVVKLDYSLLLCSDLHMRLIDLQSAGDVSFTTLPRARNNGDFEP